MKKFKHSVDISKIPDEFKCLVKDEMTNEEIALLGNVVLRYKIDSLKNRLYGWKNEKRFKGKNRKDIQKGEIQQDNTL